MRTSTHAATRDATHRCVGGSRPAGALLTVVFLAAVGCSAPTSLSRQIDKGQAAITRGITDVVDGVDGAFGEPIVTDRERIVQAKIGVAVSERENDGTTVTVPVSLRAPLPALQRRANIFLEVGSIADSLKTTRDAFAALDDNKSITAAVITQIADNVHAGVKLYFFWNEGPQVGLRPFLRWQWQRAPYRIVLDQQVYERTSEGVGEKTILQLNRVLAGTSFVRFLSSIEVNNYDEGVAYDEALIYRRLFPRHELVLSAQLGARFNSYPGDPTTKTPGAIHDADEGYFLLQATGKVYRAWLEYELTPAVHAPWNHGDKLEFAITFELRFVYESFLGGPEGGSTPATPSPQPNF